MLLLFGSTFGVQVTGSGGAVVGGESAALVGATVVITVVGSGGSRVGGSSATIETHKIDPARVQVGGDAATIEAVNVQGMELAGVVEVRLGGANADIESVLIVLQDMEIVPTGGVGVGGVAATIVTGGSFPTSAITGGARVGGDNAPIKWTLTNPNTGTTTSNTLRSTTHRGWTTIPDIIGALKTRITSSVFPDKPHLVFVDIDPPSFDYKPPNDQYILIVPPNEATEIDAIAGGGDDIDVRDARIEVRLYHRSQVDQRGHDTYWVLSEQYGVGSTLRMLESAVQLYDLTDETGTILVCEPIRILGSPSFGMDRKGQGYVNLTVQIKYRFPSAAIIAELAGV